MVISSCDQACFWHEGDTHWARENDELVDSAARLRFEKFISNDASDETCADESKVLVPEHDSAGGYCERRDCESGGRYEMMFVSFDEPVYIRSEANTTNQIDLQTDTGLVSQLPSQLPLERLLSKE